MASHSGRKRDPRVCGDRCALILYSEKDLAGMDYPALRRAHKETVETIEHQLPGGHPSSTEGYKLLDLILDEIGLRLLRV